MSKTNLVLIGFMSVGKTTIGEKIARLLNKSFVDTDKEIEKALGMTINEVFAEKGEKYFREVEGKVIRRISGYENCVISTGGGVVLNKSNIELLREKGVIICLTARPEIIYERVKKVSTRPLLAKGDKYRRIEKLLKERETLYKCADYYVDTSSLSVDEAAEKIILFAGSSQ